MSRTDHQWFVPITEGCKTYATLGIYKRSKSQLLREFRSSLLLLLSSLWRLHEHGIGHQGSQRRGLVEASLPAWWDNRTKSVTGRLRSKRRANPDMSWGHGYLPTGRRGMPCVIRLRLEILDCGSGLYARQKTRLRRRVERHCACHALRFEMRPAGKGGQGASVTW